MSVFSLHSFYLFIPYLFSMAFNLLNSSQLNKCFYKSWMPYHVFFFFISRLNSGNILWNLLMSPAASHTLDPWSLTSLTIKPKMFSPGSVMIYMTLNLVPHLQFWLYLTCKQHFILMSIPSYLTHQFLLMFIAFTFLVFSPAPLKSFLSFFCRFTHFIHSLNVDISCNPVLNSLPLLFCALWFLSPI